MFSEEIARLQVRSWSLHLGLNSLFAGQDGGDGAAEEGQGRRAADAGGGEQGAEGEARARPGGAPQPREGDPGERGQHPEGDGGGQADAAP